MAIAAHLESDGATPGKRGAARLMLRFETVGSAQSGGGHPVRVHNASTTGLLLESEGALSVDDGRLDLRWLADDKNLVLDWLETGHVWTEAALGGGGFGSQLLKISIEGQLNGTLTTEVADDKFTHRMTLPLERLEF